VEHYLPAIWNLNPGRVAIGTTLEAEDYAQDATISMMRVIELYDPTRDVKFETYVFQRVKNAFGRSRKRWLGQPVFHAARKLPCTVIFTDAGIDPNHLTDTSHGPDHNGDS
jgi:DNA-directed RNA polymerase specialized sigma24 family protein